MRKRRVAAIWIPGLPLQTVARDNSALRERPVAIIDHDRILARNRDAAEAGIAIGMRISEAATHAADLLLIPDDPRGTQACWDELLDTLDSLGPVVEDAGLGLAFVDVSGTHGNERVILRHTLTSIKTLMQFTVRAAVADGPFVAAIAARKATPTAEIVIIPLDQGAAFLAPLPVTILPLPATMHQDLQLLGVHTVKGFAALRLSDVQMRFGTLGLAALSLGNGQDTRPLIPRSHERQETLSHEIRSPT